MISKKVVYPIKDIEAAIRIYYSKNYIGNKEILDIFELSKTNRVALCRVKEYAKDLEKEKNHPCYVHSKVNTKIAYEAWGLSIKELEKDRQRLIELGMYQKCV